MKYGYLALTVALVGSALGTTEVVQAHESSREGLTVTDTRVEAPFDTVPRLCRSGNDVDGGAVVTSTQDGNFSNPATWGGQVPPADARILIAHTVTYDQQSETAYQCVEVGEGGHLRFPTDTSTKLRLDGELFVMPLGALTMGTEANPIPANVTHEVTWTEAPLQTGAVGNQGPDPSMYGKGLLVFGDITIHGAQKNPTFSRVVGDLTAGQTTIELTEAPTGWQAGDRVLIPDTKQSPLGGEETIDIYGRRYDPDVAWELNHTIAAVNGTTITLNEPLAADHLCAREADAESYYDGTITTRNDGEQLCAHVANLTRNVVFRSEVQSDVNGELADDANILKRGHAIYLHRANINVRYAQFAGMGRTTVEPIENSTYDENGTLTKIGANQIGRYATHVHHVWGIDGEHPSGYQLQMLGNAVVGSPKWCISIHDTHYGLFRDNIHYNCRGAGFVTEDGSETENVIEHNFAMRSKGSGGGPNSRDAGAVDNGHEGSGFWFRASHNYVRDNVAANTSFNGIEIMSKAAADRYIPTAPGQDPRTQPEKQAVNRLPLLEFDNNEAYSPVWVPGGGSEGNGYEGWSVRSMNNEHRISNATIWHVTRAGVQNGNGDQTRSWFDGLLIRFNHDYLEETFGQSGTRKHWAVGHRSGLVGLHSSSGYTLSVDVRRADIQGARHGFSDNRNRGGTLTGQFVVEDSYIKADVGVQVPPQKQYSVVRNTALEANPGRDYDAVRMADPAEVGDGALAMHETYLSTPGHMVLYDYQREAANNLEVFFETQDPTNTLDLQSGYGCCNFGAPEPDMTVAEGWERYGLAPWGQVATCSDTTTYPELDGIACSFTSETPNPPYGPARAVVAYPNPFLTTEITDGSSIPVKAGRGGDLSQAGYAYFQLDDQEPQRRHRYRRPFDSPLVIGFDLTDVPEGEHTLTGWIVDKDTQEELPNSRTTTSFTVGPAQPQLVITQPADGGTVPGPEVTVAYTAANVTEEVDHAHLQLDDQPEVIDQEFDGAHVFSNVATGNHTLRGYLVDANHNQIAGTETSVTFAVGEDVPDPAGVTINSPSAGSTVVGSTVTVDYTATGDLAAANVDHIHLWLDDNPEERDLEFDGSHTFTEVAAGGHTLHGYLAEADHTKVPGTDITVNFSTEAATEPNNAPTISFGQDITDLVATIGEAFTLDVTATDPDGDPLELNAQGLPAGATFGAPGNY